MSNRTVTFFCIMIIDSMFIVYVNDFLPILYFILLQCKCFKILLIFIIKKQYG